MARLDVEEAFCRVWWMEYEVIGVTCFFRGMHGVNE